MKKLLSFLLCLLLCSCIFAGCSADNEPYTKKSYASKDAKISEIRIDVRDRRVEVTPSADEQTHINYYENDKEYYNISVSENNVLTMTAADNKEWTDFIGGKASADVRIISVQVPDSLLDNLSISTTNDDIYIAQLTVNGNASLSANGGNISFDKPNVGKDITVDVKNGNISGVISGSYDDYTISCTIKKGKSNLPSDKSGGSKKLTVTANNGNVQIDIKQ